MRLLLSFKDAVEESLAHAHNDIREHLDESSVGIIGKSGIAGLGSKALYGHVVKTKIEDGVHHAGHGCSRTGTNGNQKRILRIAELLALHAFQPLQRLEDLRLCVLVNGLAVIVIVCARLGGNCETVRDRKTNVGHLSQVRTLTAKEITHVGTAFVE